jgi:hypothetical protein
LQTFDGKTLKLIAVGNFLSSDRAGRNGLGQRPALTSPTGEYDKIERNTDLREKKAKQCEPDAHAYIECEKGWIEMKAERD